MASQDVRLESHPTVSVLIASFNERFVIERTLDAVKQIDYPKDKLQVVVADDSDDQTVEVIDAKARELNGLGISTVVSRRPSREHFKCGALNKAMESVVGEFVLLLDADSIVPPDVLSKGIVAVESHPRASFAAFRYGHYNRNDNLITRLFALSQDIGDTLSKMGAYKIDAPFSFQGGFALVRTKDLRDVGLWSNERIADDGDVSIKLYLAGKRGIYLSSVKIMSEDPSTLEAWKKQVARTSQGWWRCIAKYWKTIATAKDVSVQKKVGLLLMLLGPFSGFSWIMVTFLSAFAVVTGVIQPANSMFNNPVYIGVVAVPFAVSMASGAWALWVQGLMTARNVILIPMLGYVTGAMLSLSSLGFFYGVFDRTGFFQYRTPHSGSGSGEQEDVLQALDERQERDRGGGPGGGRNRLGGPRLPAGSLVPVPVPRGVRHLHAQVDEPLQVLPATPAEGQLSEGDRRERSREPERDGPGAASQGPEGSFLTPRWVAKGPALTRRRSDERQEVGEGVRRDKDVHPLVMEKRPPLLDGGEGVQGQVDRQADARQEERESRRWARRNTKGCACSAGRAWSPPPNRRREREQAGSSCDAAGDPTGRTAWLSPCGRGRPPTLLRNVSRRDNHDEARHESQLELLSHQFLATRRISAAGVF